MKARLAFKALFAVVFALGIAALEPATTPHIVVVGFIGVLCIMATP